MRSCAGMSTPQGIDVSLCSMRYRSSCGRPEAPTEEGAFHPRRTVICPVPKEGVFVGARVGGLRPNPRYSGLPHCSGDRE